MDLNETDVVSFDSRQLDLAMRTSLQPRVFCSHLGFYPRFIGLKAHTLTNLVMYMEKR